VIDPANLTSRTVSASRVRGVKLRTVSYSSGCWTVIGVATGGIAQLVEHELCKLGVTGSNPVASTSQLLADWRGEAERAQRVKRSRAVIWTLQYSPGMPGLVIDRPVHGRGRVAQLVRACP
jgi:hypothetical protein